MVFKIRNTSEMNTIGRQEHELQREAPHAPTRKVGMERRQDQVLPRRQSTWNAPGHQWKGEAAQPLGENVCTF